ncbi:MAG: DNA polymerase III subunit gamma/tau [Candidatus Moranbacteria bacterium]|nr:DNA polymerase III subunit gamma/tau [Candidatus Moranbacteria bacterium]
MSTTLYRKYRPSDFSQVIGQKHVVQTLQNSIKSGRIGQAYLFAGPRGTGKTSIARIFAKTINCAANLETKFPSGEPCLKCDSCKTILDGRSLDIIEIDAASHTGVDNIRELRETVKLPPTSLKYKVYIIDEVHMLSGGAFNALLKTLEEPPEHVVFILATTEVHKIPETILSRVQRFDFTRLTVEEIIERLKQIAKLEKVSVEPEALEIIASSSEGGMRNAESLLGQVIALEDKKITAKEVEFILGTVSEKEIADFVGQLVAHNFPAVFSRIADLRESGIDFKNFGKSLLNYLRQMLVLKINPDLGKKLSYELTKERLGQIQKQITEIEIDAILDMINILQENTERFKNSQIPQLYLEASIASLTVNSGKSRRAEAAVSEVIDASPAPPIATQINNNKKETAEIKQAAENKSFKTSAEPKKELAEAVKKEISGDDLELVRSRWLDIIDSLKSYNHSLSSVLKMASPSLIEGNKLIVKTKYDFYKDKITETQNRLTIEDAIDKITGVNLKIKTLTEKEFQAEYPDFKEKKSLLQEAVDIFGGKIVKE